MGKIDSSVVIILTTLILLTLLCATCYILAFIDCCVARSYHFRSDDEEEVEMGGIYQTTGVHDPRVTSSIPMQ